MAVCRQVPPGTGTAWERTTTILQSAGYTTIHVGKAHFAPFKHEGEDPLALGFDVNVAGSSIGAPGSYYGKNNFGKNSKNPLARPVQGLDKYHGQDIFLTEALTLEAKAQIDKALAAKEPFFLHMSHYAVHSPFNSDPRFAINYQASNKHPSYNAYATLIEGIDKSLGDLMDHLEAKGVAEKTLIIFLGDNGGDAPGKRDMIDSCAPLRGKKGAKWEGGMRVPFVAAWAKADTSMPWQQTLNIPPNSFRQEVGTCYDLLPTIAKVAGASIPAAHIVDGRDLSPLLTGQVNSSHCNEFLNHYPHPRHGQSNFFTTWRQDNWKVIYEYLKDGNDRYSLYNLAADPSESHNLASSNPEKLKSLMHGMVRQLNSVNAQYPVKDGQVFEPIIP